MRKFQEHFFGATTLGERGQVVIPAEARKLMKLKTGEKLLTFGMGSDMLVLAKMSQLEEFADQLSARLNAIRKIMHNSK